MGQSSNLLISLNSLSFSNIKTSYNEENLICQGLGSGLRSHTSIIISPHAISTHSSTFHLHDSSKENRIVERKPNKVLFVCIYLHTVSDRQNGLEMPHAVHRAFC